ncbi:porin [Aquiflexum sp. TKW24L]|uniref:porin n=1 Tax=Aquiflexum sp. TKW24L TaxID=2942212 RepID=UPI0020C17340|nr:porin [Aquiflexum sp. TKW24L]MCL6258504.1 porin [Aquiflexum sp. TKW24L]
MRQILRFKFLVLLLFSGFDLTAQQDSIMHEKPMISLSGFLDVFYVYDFNRPEGTYRQPFLFNHNRHNEFNINLGFVKVGLDHTKYRANLALQTGTYATDNYAAEPDLLKTIFEANIGISLNKENNLWLDAGVMPSHIGFESAVSIDNWTLTRSLLAENSPYFLTGAKLTFNPNDEWEIAGLMVNGWQRIQRLEGNSLPSFGTQLKFSPNERTTFNWSTFLGTDDPDSTRRMRYFNNLYGQFQLTEQFGLIAGFDLGTQQRVKGSSEYDFWMSPVLIGQLQISRVLKTAVRVEYYQDKTGIMIPTATQNGFQTTGYSLNLDYAPNESIMCRIEGRWMNAKDRVFEKSTGPTNQNFIIASSMAIRFGK